MFNLFKKKTLTEEIYSPMVGKVINIEDVPDPVFKEKMVGDGLAIEPTEGTVYSPIDGTIIQIFPTKHAIGIKSQNGLEILVHIGMDTVEMKGEGFESFIEEGQNVKKGDKLITFDIDKIKDQHPLISPIIITNMNIVDSIEKVDGGIEAHADKTKIMKIYLK